MKFRENYGYTAKKTLPNPKYPEKNFTNSEADHLYPMVFRK
jgi:hypothetical protein